MGLGAMDDPLFDLDDGNFPGRWDFEDGNAERLRPLVFDGGGFRGRALRLRGGLFLRTFGSNRGGGRDLRGVLRFNPNFGNGRTELEGSVRESGFFNPG